MSEKVAVHFGGGAIGRGFVGQFLHQSGYKLIFVDVVDELITALQSTPSYTVTEVSDEGENKSTVDNYSAINSKTEEKKLVEAISTADTVTCAVGPRILEFIAKSIANGIEARSPIKTQPLVVIACENAINATDILLGHVKTHLSSDTIENLKSKARFANCAVDRIVPTQEQSGKPKLDITIEAFWEWTVENRAFEGIDAPKIKGVHYVDDLAPYIERKLFTVNTGHATAAYYGYQAGKKYIHETLADDSIRQKVDGVLEETANLIVKKHKISADQQKQYVTSIIKRFSSAKMVDPVTRVGRAPLRKLSLNERFIGPASQLAKMGESTTNLVNAIEMAFRFQDVEGDEESAKLALILKQHKPDEVVETVTGLKAGDPLFKEIVGVVERVQHQAAK